MPAASPRGSSRAVRSRRPPSSSRSSTGTCPAWRARGPGTPQSASSRPCASRSTPSSKCSRSASRARSSCSAPKGRCVVLSYHSGEDRLVKQTLRSGRDRWLYLSAGAALRLRSRGHRRVLTRGARLPSSADEAARNPRAASARLRAAERLAQADSPMTDAASAASLGAPRTPDGAPNRTSPTAPAPTAEARRRHALIAWRRVPRVARRTVLRALGAWPS